MESMIDRIIEYYEEETFLKADGFDDAIIGVEEGGDFRLIYSIKKCIDILVEQGMTDDEAWEFFDFNVRGSYVGEKTPIWCMDTF